MSAEVLLGDLAEEYNERADIVLANLTADILMKLRLSLPVVTRPGSVVIMSGIINSRAREVLDVYLSDGVFELIGSEKKGEWQAFAMRRQ